MATITSVIVTNKRELYLTLSTGFIQARNKALVQIHLEVITMYNRWQRTWERKYPITSERGTDEVVVRVENTGGAGHSDYDSRPARDNIPVYLNYGTKARKVALTRSFRPKTTPGQIDSVFGSGGVLDFGGPFPGIKPRKVTDAIAEKLENNLIEEIFCKYFEQYFK